MFNNFRHTKTNKINESFMRILRDGMCRAVLDMYFRGNTNLIWSHLGNSCCSTFLFPNQSLNPFDATPFSFFSSTPRHTSPFYLPGPLLRKTTPPVGGGGTAGALPHTPLCGWGGEQLGLFHSPPSPSGVGVGVWGVAGLSHRASGLGLGLGVGWKRMSSFVVP